MCICTRVYTHFNNAQLLNRRRPACAPMPLAPAQRVIILSVAIFSLYDIIYNRYSIPDLYDITYILYRLELLDRELFVSRACAARPALSNNISLSFMV